MIDDCSQKTVDSSESNANERRLFSHRYFSVFPTVLPVVKFLFWTFGKSVGDDRERLNGVCKRPVVRVDKRRLQVHLQKCKYDFLSPVCP